MVVQLAIPSAVNKRYRLYYKNPVVQKAVPKTTFSPTSPSKNGILPNIDSLCTFFPFIFFSINVTHLKSIDSFSPLSTFLFHIFPFIMFFPNKHQPNSIPRRGISSNIHPVSRICIQNDGCCHPWVGETTKRYLYLVPIILKTRTKRISNSPKSMFKR